MKMPDLEIGNIINYRIVLLDELSSIDEKIESCIDNQDYQILIKELNFRADLLQKIIKLDEVISAKNGEKSQIREEQVTRHAELIEKIKNAESTILTKLYLKKDEVFSDYQNLVRGLDTLKGYRDSLHKEKDTINIF
jgi:hypothetical protein